MEELMKAAFLIILLFISQFMLAEVNEYIAPTEADLPYALKEISTLKPYLSPLNQDVNSQNQEYIDTVQKVREIPEDFEPVPTRDRLQGILYQPVVLLRFYDEPDFPGTIFNDLGLLYITTNNYSVRKFFADESDEQLSIFSYFSPPASATYNSYYIAHSRNYYRPATYYTDGYSSIYVGLLRLRTLVSDVVEYLDTNNLIPPQATTDLNNDGKLDNITIYFRGEEDYINWLLYPRHDQLPSGWASLNGLEVCDYNIAFEDSPVGKICHNISRTLGFPVLYRENPEASPVHSYDVMGIGNYWDWPSYSSYSLVYMKHKYGQWCSEPPTITAEGLYTLNSIYNDPFAAYKIPSNNPNQYYIALFRTLGLQDKYSGRRR
jgi:M6 family metalloprotease-like protein